MSRATARRCRSVRSSAVAAVAALLVAGATATAAETYAIKLDRPAKVGQEFTVTATADVDRTVKVTANGQAQPDKNDKYKAELTGTQKVESVNDKTGSATKVTVTVDKLTKDGTDLFPAGTVITADHTGAKTAYTVAGADVDPEKAAVLDSLIEVGSADQAVSEDQAMGTDKPQAVGGTWDGDSAKVVDMLSGEQLPISAEHVKASGKLVAVKAVDGTPSEVVESTITADAFDAGKQMQGLTVTGGSFDGKVTETLPTDAALPATAMDGHFKMALKATGGGGAVTVDVSGEQTTHRTMAPKK